MRNADWEKINTVLIPQQNDQQEALEACLALIKRLVAISGGTVADVTACESLCGLVVWVDVRDQAVSPVPLVSFNFLGKLSGRPVLSLVDREGHWILQEDGKLDPFDDFDAWWNFTPMNKNNVSV